MNFGPEGFAVKTRNGVIYAELWEPEFEVAARAAVQARIPADWPGAEWSSFARTGCRGCGDPQCTYDARPAFVCVKRVTKATQAC